MDVQAMIILAMSMGLAIALSQWNMWRGRAISALNTANSCKGQMIRSQEILNNLDDERRVQYEALMDTFDFINDNGPFGTNDVGLMQVKGVVLAAIQTSTYGRAK